MQNIKLSKPEDNPRKRLVEWIVRVKFLKGQIEKLERLKDLVIISISVFLLKCQIIEFEIKQTIFSLDFHLYSQNRSELINRQVRTPKDLENLTLGQLVGEFKKFVTSSDVPISTGRNTKLNDKSILNQLKQKLGILVKKRNKFTHKLFSLREETSILAKDAQEGIDIANKTLKLLERLENELSSYEN